MYTGAEGEEEPEWVKNEKEQFSMFRDKDGNGLLDFEEVIMQFNVLILSVIFAALN